VSTTHLTPNDLLDHPHECIDSWHYIGVLEHDEETGKEVGMQYRVPCVRCCASPSEAGEAS
jgi:hypothetical protein